MSHFIKIPKERIAVLIGSNGDTKKYIEKKIKSSININSDDGSVEIIESEDALSYLKGIDVVKAISRGFSPERAFSLFDDEDLSLDVVDLSNFVSTNNELLRLKGRIIGKEGKTRDIAEKLINCKISVYGKTVSIIGNSEQNAIIKTMLDMFINGVNHGTIYNYLEKKHDEINLKTIEYFERK